MDNTTDLQVIQCNASNQHGYAFAAGYLNVLRTMSRHFIFCRIPAYDSPFLHTVNAVQWLAQGFHWGQDRRPRAEAGFLGRGSNPSPPVSESGGALRPPSAEFGADPRPPKGFHYFHHSRMASPDTIVLLIVDYDAAIGGPRPRAPNAYAPNALPVGRDLLSDFPYFLVFFFFSSFFVIFSFICVVDCFMLISL